MIDERIENGKSPGGLPSFRNAGLALRGLRHEIYLGNPSRCAPEKLKTVLRHPVKK
jgi:hypothetical protein